MYRSFTSVQTPVLTLAFALGLGVVGAQASTLTPSVGFTPSGGANLSGVYTDDVFLDSLTFGLNNYAWGSGNSGDFIIANEFKVLSGRSEVNAEFGDTDDGTDGDANPFVKAGVSDANLESTDLTIQDPALLAAFSSRSLSEITDGENRNNGGHSFKVGFTDSVTVADDGLPNLVLFERNGNDIFTIELITGGTFGSPTYSGPVTIDSGSFADAGFAINTTEIGGAQKMTVGGFNFADLGLGLANGDSVSGFKLTTNGGPDLAGFFLKNDPDFGEISSVPLPASVWFLLSALGASYGFARRRRAA